MSRSIRIIPHGAGNIGSLMDLFHQIGHFPHVAESPGQLKSADIAVLPVVGASGSAMKRLDESGFSDALKDMHARQRPLIGICVGAQVLFEHLEEDDCTGLGLIRGDVTRIAGGAFNNGWCDVNLQGRRVGEQPMLLKSSAKTFFFNHGYQINTCVAMDELGVTSPDAKLLAYFLHKNLCGIQFHPEKSQAAGLAFIGNAMKHYGL